MVSRLIYSVLLSIIVSSYGYSQKETYSHSSSWNALTFKIDLDKNLFFRNELNIRRTNFLEDWEQLVIRPSLQYNVEKGLRVGMGYSYVDNSSYSDYSAPLAIVEQNIWQQLFISQDFKKFNISHRIRFEERFKERISTNDENLPFILDPVYSGRLRYRFIVTYPIIEKKLSILTYDEVFLEFKKDWLPQEFTQNRFYIGDRFRESDHITIKTGYNRLNLIKSDEVITNHIWETTLIYSI